MYCVLCLKYFARFSQYTQQFYQYTFPLSLNHLTLQQIWKLFTFSGMAFLSRSIVFSPLSTFINSNSSTFNLLFPQCQFHSSLWIFLRINLYKIFGLDFSLATKWDHLSKLKNYEMAFKNLFEAVSIQNTLLQRILLDISYWPWIFSMSCTEIAVQKTKRNK